jgi:hypothetical protein
LNLKWLYIAEAIRFGWIVAVARQATYVVDHDLAWLDQFEGGDDADTISRKAPKELGSVHDGSPLL